MKPAAGIICVVVAALGLVSCAAVRTFTVDQSDPCQSPDSLMRQYKPSGIVRELWYDCSVDGPSRRRLIAYLPADYDETGNRYPVLYALHGARGNELSWIKDGNLLALTDSLFASGSVEPYIVILPNMNQYKDDADFGNSRYKLPFESFFETDGAVESSFVNDVVTAVDKNFRTVPDKAHRAIMGISIGAFQAAHISASAPDVFDYVALYSPFYKAPVKKSKYSGFFKGLEQKQKAQFANPPELYQIGIGYWDFFILHMDTMRHQLGKHGYRYEFMRTGGGHDWSNWQQYYFQLGGRLF